MAMRVAALELRIPSLMRERSIMGLVNPVLGDKPVQAIALIATE